MKHVITPVLFFLMLRCGLFGGIGIDGPAIITRHDAEKKIAGAIFLKAGFCGYDPVRSYSIKDLGNAQVKKGNLFKLSSEQKGRNVYYDAAAVDYCVTALAFMPCPVARTVTPSGKIYDLEFDLDFIALVAVTRTMNCNFNPVDFFDFEEPLEGRIF